MFSYYNVVTLEVLPIICWVDFTLGFHRRTEAFIMKFILNLAIVKIFLIPYLLSESAMFLTIFNKR